MGASGSAEALAMPNAQVRHRAVLTSTQRGKVEEALFELKASAKAAGTEGSCGPSPVGEDRWLIFYDNQSMALTLRDWWLCETEGSWLLRVPLLKPNGTAGLCTSGYEELTDVEEILTRVGLVQHAEALRKGLVKNVERLLAQANVTPFARVHASSCFYRLHETVSTPPGVSAGAAPEGAASRDVRLALHLLSFDAKFAEPEAIANLVFSQGAAARDQLSVSLAELLRPGADGEAADSPDAMASQLLRGGAECSLSSQTPFPEAMAYIHALRPNHLRALRRAGVVWEDKAALAL